ncbi:MAG: HU family DNA-binding protein [Solirubrobacterales bacterium]
MNPHPQRGGTVTKQEFITQIRERADLSTADATKAVDAVLDTITDTLKRGGEVAFTGFGKFSVSDRSARQGVNPQTGERIQIAASKVPRFSAGAKLKQTVKGG